MPVWRDVVQGARKVSPGSVDNVSQAARIENLDLRYDEILLFLRDLHQLLQKFC